jgi:hypothetical protein
MGFLKRIRSGGDSPSVPPWANFMEPGEYAEFRRLVDGWMRSHNRPYREVDTDGLEVTRADGEPLVLGLVNLAQMVHQAPRSERQQLVARHFGNVISHPYSAPDETFEEIRSMIKVRVYPENFGADNADVVSRPIAAGLQAILFIDYPTAIKSFSSGQAEKSGLSIDELFDLGLANVQAQDVPESSMIDGTPIRMLSGDSFFVATWALMLDRLPAPQSEHGALAVLPHRHLLLHVPIVDLSVVESVGPLLDIAGRQFQKGPGSITPSLYWWRSGSLTLLPATLTGHSVNFAPPDDFVEMLNLLPAASS